MGTSAFVFILILLFIFWNLKMTQKISNHNKAENKLQEFRIAGLRYCTLKV